MAERPCRFLIADAILVLACASRPRRFRVRPATQGQGRMSPAAGRWRPPGRWTAERATTPSATRPFSARLGGSGSSMGWSRQSR